MKRVKLSGGEDESPSGTRDLSDSSGAGKLFETRILTIPLITDLVFTDFLYSDLLNYSLVSNAWNKTCRGILVDKFRTYLTLSEKSTAQDLEDFYNLIRDAVPGLQHPVNGIRIKFNTRTREWPFSSEPILDLLKRIMEQIQVKCVSFDMSNLHFKAAVFRDALKTLVIPHLRTIEFLEVLNFGGNFNTLSKELRVNSLLNLKELDFGNSQDRLKKSTFKRILRACPNLKIIPAVFPYQLPTLRFTKHLPLASKVRFNYMRLTIKDLKLLAVYSPLIKHLDITQHYQQRRNQYEGDFISKLRPLFTSHCQHKLESLDIDLEPLIGILQSPMPPLVNVKELLCRGGQRWFPCLFKNKAVRFAQFFPNLKAVTFSWTWKYSRWLHNKYRSQDYEDRDGPYSLLECQIPASLDSVTTLRLYCLGKDWLSPYETFTRIMDLDETFPSVTHLDIHMNLSGLEDFFQWICESWGDRLETLILRGTKCLGFHPKPFKEGYFDWSDLQEYKRKDLPPGIMYSDKLSNLRRLELKFRHRKERDCTGNFVEEKVKVQAGFEPRTGHKVQVVISGCRAEKRLKNIKDGVSIYDTILALHPCPRNLELLPMEEIIGDKLICRTICKLLPTKDLRSCCRVSRSWNAVAREVFHERGSFILTLNPLDFGGCFFDLQKTSNKLAWVARGNQKLFNHLRINYNNYNYYCYSTSNGRFYSESKAFARFLDELDFTETRFEVLEVPYLIKTESPGVVAEMTAHLINVCKTLFQKLNVYRVQKLVTSIELFDRLFRNEEGNLLLPNLHSIAFFEPENLLSHHRVFRRLLRDLHSLERIDVPVSNKLLPMVTSAGKAHCVKHMQLQKFPEQIGLDGDIFPMYWDAVEIAAEYPLTTFGSLLEFVEKHEPRIETLSVGDDVSSCGRAFLRMSPQKMEPALRRIFQRLCTSSSESLHTLNLNLPFLHFISGLRTPPLIALKAIRLLCLEEALDPQGLLTQIPFSDMAPNLEEVNLTRAIHSSPDIIPGEQVLACERSELMPSRPCSSVKSMEYKVEMRGWSSWDGLTPPSPEPWIMEYVGRVFPNITKLSFSGSGEGAANDIAVALSSTWKAWPTLEIVEISASMDEVSFETRILGISKEEWSAWKELLRYGTDALNNVHYAPSSSSIRDCKNLKEFRISFCVNTRLVRHSWTSPWRTVPLTRTLCD